MHSLASFTASSGHLYSLACGSFLEPSKYITLVSDLSSYHFLLSLTPLASLLQGPLWLHLEPTRIIQGNLHISGSLISSHLQSPFCHLRSHPQVPGIRMWTSWVGGRWSLFSLPQWVFWLFEIQFFTIKNGPSVHILACLFVPMWEYFSRAVPEK